MSGNHEVQRRLTSADILNLHTTPVILVPARPGMVAIPDFCMMRIRFGGVAYVGTGTLAIGYPESDGGVGDLLSFTATYVTRPDDYVAWAAIAAFANGGPDAQLLGRPLVAFAETAFTAGNGTFDLIVSYLDMPIFDALAQPDR